MRLRDESGWLTGFGFTLIAVAAIIGLVGTIAECYIQVDGQWIPEERWRVLGDTP